MSSSVVSLNDGRGPSATKDRILDAAEGLFMEHGIEATSLRSIMLARPSRSRRSRSSANSRRT